MSSRRLDTGGLIDRDQSLEFTWDGLDLSGYSGDTLASALLANDQQVIGRSFKYHRPRGIMSAGVEEAGALITVGEGAHRNPNVKATVQALYSGLQASGQNAWPSVRFDMGGVANLFGRFFAAGFYYKTFMGLPPFEWFSKGTGLWMQYEKIIRRAAGMGEASRLPDPDHYEHGHLFCDVLVVGAGPAGLHAAITAASLKLDVILVEQDFELGGDLLNQPEAQAKRLALIKEVQSADVRVMTRTSAFGLYDHGVAGLLEQVTDHMAQDEITEALHLPRQRFWTLRAKHTILATGALERHFAFGHNDRPGIMSASAAQAYLNRYAVLVGDKIVIAGNNDSIYPAASDLAQAGAAVTVLDARTQLGGAVYEQALEHGVEIRTTMSALSTLGGKKIRGLKTAKLAGELWQPAEQIDCDAILLSGGWSPVVNLLSQRGIRPVWNAQDCCFIAPKHDQAIDMAGAAAGVWLTVDCEASGRQAGEQAAKALGAKVRLSKRSKPSPWDNPITPLYEVKVKGIRLKSFVDPQHDVTAEDVRLAHREGFVSVEHLKRYTTLGMATDQGKMGNIMGLALMADALGKEIPDVGTTTFRPPYTPISLGALAGRGRDAHFKPLRRTPMHDWNIAHCGTMTEAGLWQRPWYFARDGETITGAYIREATTVRASVGLCDVTSLGKIAVQGPDSAQFLNRIYSNAFAKLPIAKARYGIMLRDDGVVMDDGTTWRLDEHDYFMTTTTAHAAKVMVWLEELLQTRWPDLRVHVSSVSDQWAGCAVAGPQSRAALQAVLKDAQAITNEACPFMGVVQTTLKNGVQCRIARISFSGEMAFEIYVPADYATVMMDLLWKAAKPLEGCLYGLESLGALRIEKGHVTGAELDGRVTIEDAGLAQMASTKKAYIGSALRTRPAMQDPERPKLVGVFPKERSQTFNAGALLVGPDQPTDAESYLGDGWITAVTHSPALGHWIGLGFVAGGHQAWAGKTLQAYDPVRSSNIEVEVVSAHMFDPKGERMHG